MTSKNSKFNTVNIKIHQQTTSTCSSSLYYSDIAKSISMNKYWIWYTFMQRKQTLEVYKH